MKFKSIICYAVVIVMFNVITSCSEEYAPEMIVSDASMSTRSAEIDSTQGRFDSIPFKWDYSFSTDSLTEENGFSIYPVEEAKSEDVDNISTCGARPPINPGSGWSNEYYPDTDSSVSTDQMLLIDPNIVYVGAAYPESTFAKDYS